MSINLPFGDLVEGTFVKRLHRFVIICQLKDGKNTLVEAHLADPGRLRELLIPHRTIWLRHNNDPNRKTRWSAILIESEAKTIVSLVSTLPNQLIKSALAKKKIPALAAWTLERSEFTVGKHRYDFLLNQADKLLLLEVKSVTLVDNGVALFPDAVTLRGRKHLESLADLSQSGAYETAVLFVVQRNDALKITAASHIDPRFAQAMRSAYEAGVKFLGIGCDLTTTQISLAKVLPVVVPN